VLKKLPKTPISGNETMTEIDKTIVEHLKFLRGTKDFPGPSKRRRTKLNVIPGRSVGGAESEDTNDADTICHSDSEMENDEQEEFCNSNITEGFIVEEMVIVRYEGSNFPGRIMEIKNVFYLFEDVIEKLPSDSVVPHNDRGVYVVNSTKLSMWSD